MSHPLHLFWIIYNSRRNLFDLKIISSQKTFGDSRMHTIAKYKYIKSDGL